MDRPRLPSDKVCQTLVADAVEARKWANSLLAGVSNGDADLIQVKCLVGCEFADSQCMFVCVGSWLVGFCLMLVVFGLLMLVVSVHQYMSWAQWLCSFGHD